MFTIRLAENVQDREIAFRLRYEVFTKEQGRTALADHTTQFYRDEFDDDSSNIFLALDSQERAVGTLRLTPRHEKPFSDENEYELNCLSEKLSLPQLQLHQIGLASRGVILPEARGGKLYEQMWDALFLQARKIGLKVIVGTIDSKNRGLCAYHKRHHWISYRYAVPFTDIAANFVAIKV